MEIVDYIVATDQQLVDRVLQGDALAFEQLFNRYRGSIHQLYLQRTAGNADDTDDLLQEAFVKAYLNLHRYNPAYTFGQWIYTIARNTFIDYVRRRRDDTVSIDNTSDTAGYIAAHSTPSPEESLINDQNRRQLESFINKMTPRYRQLIELRFFREFSYEEIAAELSLPMGTVKTQIHRAREQLCRFISESEENLL